ncbi:sensor domain-containing diguanylate cyclase [Cronobacter turicensis]|uniref:sensor domain-containing diguanylate cyclase n=1 Tax=Cronobacter turicensis TaxID=413502 RepID=UPI0024C2C07F|nr:sensor domain-containing diguanylate cyclase [Cronobacter turicensis]EKM5066015.1 sensor domain-containing diguanylate cyclase [Cronobacter turicensis]EKM5761046.1 sensor domain-containing diguanylate cyclase [Cronobacter turicensis]ELY3838056.1 sensor domain-containing diguanylate cyclase [Cronobacter turicensis]ELY5850486.1 sensor domain-containing diguanylate cyclase [Cronobacter turicensis]ELY7491001.1 sensor domain-containing diguanylate cyclase [Cronobacter turicensis]
MTLRQFISYRLGLSTSLGRSLAVLLLFLLVGGIGTNILVFMHSWDDEIAQAANKAVNLSVAQVRQAEDTFMAVGQTLDDVRTTVGAGQASTYHNYLVRLKARQPLLDGLYFYNAQGMIKGSSSGITGIPEDITHKDFFRFHDENRQTGIHIGRVIKSLASDELVIPVSVRVNDLSGGFAGVVLATVKLEYFQRFYSYFELGPRDMLALLLTDGSVLCVRPYDNAKIDMNISGSPLFTRELIRADRGTGTWVASLDHIERVFGFARTEKLPLVVVAGYDRAEVRMHWLRNNLPGLLSNFMLLLGFLVFSSVVFRKVRSSIRDQQELKQLRDELLKANQTFKSMAMADSLTGLANRRKFDTTLAKVLADSATSGSPVSLIMLDIDFFKRYNDSRGHAAGDACLRLIGNTLQMVTLRTCDLVARYGGEEFAIVLPETTGEEALALAQRAVSMIRDKHLPHPSTDLPEQVVTISAGCHTVRGNGREDAFSVLIRGADTALYLAKNRGRNQAFRLPNTIATGNDKSIYAA